MTGESTTEEILVNVTSSEVRAALLENGVLQEIYVERSARRGVISNIYKGRVSRVLPGMQAAFVDIGLDRTAFLHASDIATPEIAGRGENPANIKDLVREGECIMVQVVKDPLGNKGARLSTFVTLPSRHLVLTPHSTTVGVSARIENEDERERLRSMVTGLLAAQGQSCGAIVRTVAEGCCEDAILADLQYALKLWELVQQRCRESNAKSLIHEDLSLPLRVLRDLVSTDVERILVDSEAEFRTMQEFIDTYLPGTRTVLERYERRRPIFDLHGIEDEIRKSLDRSISLKSGGYIIFDQTESMTTVDVNTGGYVGHRNLEETIYRTNLEAAVAIARQLRLRNLGGIIIIDFIDMQEEEHRDNVLQLLEKSLARDHARHQISTLSPLGLVEMTRKRTRESLQHILTNDCRGCSGRGFVLSAETVCFEIFREVIRQSRQFEFSEALVLAHEDVIGLLLDEQAGSLAELEAQSGKSIRLQTESLYLQDQFDVVLM